MQTKNAQSPLIVRDLPPTLRYLAKNHGSPKESTKEAV